MSSVAAERTRRLVSESLESIKHVFEDDTENSLAKIDSLRQTNTSNTLQYIKKEEELKQLSMKADNISRHNDSLNESLQHLDDLESKVDVLERITDELDEYSKELEVKINRLTK